MNFVPYTLFFCDKIDRRLFSFQFFTNFLAVENASYKFFQLLNVANYTLSGYIKMVIYEPKTCQRPTSIESNQQRNNCFIYHATFET